jgi:hypothetical protein
MQVDNLLIIKQPLGTFFDRRVDIKAMNMFGVRLGCGHFNERLQHLRKNLHILLQNHVVAPKALACPDNVACKVKNGHIKLLM